MLRKSERHCDDWVTCDSIGFGDEFAISDNHTFAPNVPHTRQTCYRIPERNGWVQASKYAEYVSKKC